MAFVPMMGQPGIGQKLAQKQRRTSNTTPAVPSQLGGGSSISSAAANAAELRRRAASAPGGGTAGHLTPAGKPPPGYPGVSSATNSQQGYYIPSSSSSGAISPSSASMQATLSSLSAASAASSASAAAQAPLAVPGPGVTASTSRASSRRSSVEHQLLESSPHQRAVREAWVRKDVEELRKLSSKGYCHDAMRRLVWPLILHAPPTSLPAIAEEDVMRRRDQLSAENGHAASVNEKDEHEGNLEEKSKGDVGITFVHKDEYQVKLDVDRSFILMGNDEQRDKKRAILKNVILSILRDHPSLNYFQGYHDIVSIIVLVCEDDAELALRITSRMSLFHIRDSMFSTLTPTVGYLRLLKRILEQADPELALAVEKASSIPYFSLSWVLTLLAHDLTSIDVTSRIFDFLLAHNPAMISYLSAAIVIAKKSDLQDLDPDIAGDPATLHTVLSKLPKLTTDAPTPKPAASPRPKDSPRILPNAGPTLAGLATAFSIFAGVTEPTHTPPGSSGMRSRSVSQASSDPYSDDLDHGDLPFSPFRRRLTTADKPLSLDTLFKNALDLHDRYPLTHAKVDAASIFGPKSAVFTWSHIELSEVEAEKIVADGVDVILPDPEEEAKKRLELEEKRRIDDARRRLLRKTGRVRFWRVVDAVHWRLHHYGLTRSKTVWALLGIAGVVIAIYANTVDEDRSVWGAKNWLRSSWVTQFQLKKL